MAAEVAGEGIGGAEFFSECESAPDSTLFLAIRCALTAVKCGKSTST